MRIVLAVGGARGDALAEELADEGLEVVAHVEPQEVRDAAGDRSARIHEALRDADALVLRASRSALASEVVAMCDRAAVRIVALGERLSDRRAAQSFGVPEPLALDASGSEIAASARSRTLAAPRDAAPDGRLTVVWGPHGAPGRSTLALALASELAASARVAVVDADSHAPAIAQMLGLPDEAPGFPAACRQADYGLLDGPELTRLSTPVDLGDRVVEVLTGINRPARWPELAHDRVRRVLEATRGWIDETIVDIAAPLEADEEIVSDLDGPRRNAGGLAALESADRVLAVASADPVGIARFVRGWAELRERAPGAEVRVVVNRMRQGPFGLDAGGQVRRALAQLADVDDPFLLPHDVRAVDRAHLAAAPVRPQRRRAGLAHAVARLAATL